MLEPSSEVPHHVVSKVHTLLERLNPLVNVTYPAQVERIGQYTRELMDVNHVYAVRSLLTWLQSADRVAYDLSTLAATRHLSKANRQPWLDVLNDTREEVHNDRFQAAQILAQHPHYAQVAKELDRALDESPASHRAAITQWLGASVRKDAQQGALMTRNVRAIFAKAASIRPANERALNSDELQVAFAGLTPLCDDPHPDSLRAVHANWHHMTNSHAIALIRAWEEHGTPEHVKLWVELSRKLGNNRLQEDAAHLLDRWLYDHAKDASWKQTPAMTRAVQLSLAFKRSARGVLLEHPTVALRAIHEAFQPSMRKPFTSRAHVDLYLQQLRAQHTRGHVK